MTKKLRMYLEKIKLDLEEEQEKGCNLDVENITRMNCGKTCK